LIYLRDNKPGIPFPRHWDLFRGHVEEGETPEEVRYFSIEEIPKMKFANILKKIVLDYLQYRANNYE